MVASRQLSALVAVQKEVHRGGRTHYQTFWVRDSNEQVERTSDVQLARLQATRTAHLDIEGRPELPSGRQWVEKLPHHPEESWQDHFDKNPEDGGKPTPERAKAVHQPFIDNALAAATPVAEGEQPVAILTMGAPASGKSAMLKGLPSGKFVMVDSDAAKSAIPEYQEAVAGSARNAARMAHNESTYMAHQVRDAAISNRQNLVVDGTGKHVESFASLIDKLHENGYHVRVMMADLDEETGIERMRSRAEKTGRYVPEEIARSAYRVVPGNFEKIARRADSFALFNTRVSPSEKIWSHEDGVDTVHNVAAVAEFKARAGR